MFNPEAYMDAFLTDLFGFVVSTFCGYLTYRYIFKSRSPSESGYGYRGHGVAQVELNWDKRRITCIDWAGDAIRGLSETFSQPLWAKIVENSRRDGGAHAPTHITVWRNGKLLVNHEPIDAYADNFAKLVTGDGYSISGAGSYYSKEGQRRRAKEKKLQTSGDKLQNYLKENGVKV